MSEKEKIKIKTDDGYDIEAEIISREKIGEKTGEKIEELSNIKIGDAVVNIYTGHIGKVTYVLYRCENKSRVLRLTVGGSNNNGNESPRWYRLATEEETALAEQYTPYELQLRDEFAKAALTKMALAYNDSNGYESTTVSAQLIYEQAEAMLEVRQSLQHKVNKDKKDEN